MKGMWKRFVAIAMAGIMLFSNAGELPLTVNASEMNEPVIVEEIGIPEETQTVAEEESVVIAVAEEDTGITEDEPEVASEGEAADNYCGNTVTWTLADGVLTISGTGAMFDYSKVSATPWYANASEITSVVIEDGVTTVAAYGFREFAALESVVIGNDVTTIGSYAFYKCTVLQSVVLGSSVMEVKSNAFYGDTAIAEMTLPNQECKTVSSSFSKVNPSTIKIREDAVAVSVELLNYTNLTSIQVIEPAADGEAVNFEAVDDVLFKIEDTGKQLVRYPSAKTDVTEYTIPEDVVSMADYAFSETSLTKVYLPENLQNISAYAFNECANLEEIIIPDSVVSVGEYAFYNNTALLQAVVGDGVVSIGKCAFYKCTAMTVFVFGANVTKIEDGAFDSTSAVEELTVPNQYTVDFNSGAFDSKSMNPSIVKIRGDATGIYEGFLNNTNTESFEVIEAADTESPVNFQSDQGVLYSEKGTVLERFPIGKTDDLAYVVPDGVTVIDEFAFESSKVESVDLPESVTEIRRQSFMGCTALTSVTGGKSLLAIGDYAFSGCTSLKKAVIGEEMTAIGTRAFDKCSALTEVVLPDTVTSVGDYAFNLCTGLQTVVLGSGITQIGKRAFYKDTAIETIVVPNQECTTFAADSFTSVAPTKIVIREDAQSISRAFLDFASVTAFEMTEPAVENAEGNFKAEDGVLYSADGSQMLRYPVGKTDLAEYTVLDSVTTMSDYAFQETVSLPKGLSNIPDYGFYHCTNLTEIIIPDSVQSIGTYSFAGNTALAKADVGDGVKTIGAHAFRECAALSDLTLGECVEKIETYAFYKCSSLTKVIIPGTVEIIGVAAFALCDALEEVDMGSGLTYFGTNAFNGENIKILTIPNQECSGSISNITPSVIRIHSDAQSISEMFLEYASVTSFEVIEPVTEGAEANYKSVDGVLYSADGSRLICYPKGKSEESYAVAEGTKVIESNAFAGTQVKRVSLPDTMEEVKDRAFTECTSLVTIDLGEGISTIGESAFERCTSLGAVALPDSITSLGEYSFYKCSGMSTLTIGDGIITIPFRAFEACTSLSVVEFGEQVQEIGEYAFGYCESLVSLEFPQSLTTLGGAAFVSCIGLKEVIVPDSVTSMVGATFIGCTSLERAVLSLNLKTAGGSIFGNTSLTDLTLPNTGVIIEDIPETVKTIRLHGDAKGFGAAEAASQSFVQEYIVLEPVDETDPINYQSVDGVLYTADGKELTAYPRGKEDSSYDVLDGTEVIGEFAFANFTTESVPYLTEIHFPDTLKEIGDKAFYCHTGLTSISLPEGVKRVGAWAFDSCLNLSKIYVPDSVKEIGDSGIYKYSDYDLTIYCTKNSYAEEYAIAKKIPYVTSNYHIGYTLNRKYSVVEGEEEQRLKEDIANYQVTLLNQTTGEVLTGYTIYDSSINLPMEKVSVGDVIEITLVSKNGETLDYQTEVTLDENVSATVDMTVQEKGYIVTAPETAMETSILVFDSNGNRLESMLYKNEPCVSDWYEDGEYQLLYIQGPNQYWMFDTLSDFSERGLAENQDYITKKVKINSGIVAKVEDVIVPEIDLELFRYLDETSVYMAESAAYVNGLLQMRVDYAFSELRKDEVTPEVIYIKIPDNAKYVENSMTLDGKPVSEGALYVGETYLEVDISNSSGVLRWMFRPYDHKAMSSTAKIGFKTAERTLMETIGEIREEIPSITLSCPSQTSDGEILVYGTAVPQARIGIYDGAVRIGTAIASKAGNWKANVILNELQNGSIHKIQAKIQMGTSEEVASNAVNVLYNEEHFEVTEFTLHENYTYRGKPYYKADDLLSGKTKQNFTLWLMKSNPYLTFTIKVSDNEAIEKMYVVSSRNLGTRKLEAFYDSELDTWIASGRFGLENERNYIPGDLSLEIVKSEKGLVKDFSFVNEVDGEALREALVDPYFADTVNTYDKNTDRGVYGGTLVFGEEGESSLEFEYSKKDVEPGTYTYEELLKEGFIEIETLDTSSKTLAKMESDANGGVTLRAIQVPILSRVRSANEEFDWQTSLACTTANETLFSSMNLLEVPGADGVNFAINMLDAKTNGSLDETIDKVEEKLTQGYTNGKLKGEEYYKKKQQIENAKVQAEMLRTLRIATTTISTVGPMAAFAGPPGLAATLILWGSGIVSNFVISLMEQYLQEEILKVQVDFSIDPSGYVYEGVPSNRVEGVTATVYYRETDADGNEKAVLWNAEEYDQQNPQITNEVGFYQWFVPEGYWQVKYEKEGYETAYSEWLPVPPPQTEVNIGLVSTEPPTVELVELYDDYAMVTFSKYMKADTINSDTVKVLTMAGKEAAYEMEAVNGETVDGINLATQFKLKFTNSLANGNYKVKVAKSVVNYADLTLESDYESVFAAKSAIRGLKAEVPENIVMNEVFTIPVIIDSEGDCSGYTLKAESSDFVEVVNISDIKDNVANITLKAKLPGTAVVQLSLDGTMIRENVEFNITMTPVEEEPTGPEKPEEPDKPIDPPVDPPVEEKDEVVRLYGSGRYETGYKVADQLKEALGVEKFEAVVVATGKNFADALAGSYLAVEKKAPILLTNGKADNVAELHAYIKENVQPNGMVYILGGEGAVPETVDAIKGYTVKRLFGSSRYDTNIEILKEAGVNGDSIIVATGKTFADSLSASAAKLPILLVKPNGTLNDVQKSFLKDMKHIYIVGGEGAVSKAYEKELAEYAEVIRVFGSSRYDTSVEVAKTFCKDVKLAVVASGKNFPDGLCGGPLAAALNAPLVLTKDNGSDAAAAYVAANEIKSGYVLGGSGALSDETVVNVFALKGAEEII